jgi:hypothetical protein
MGYLLVLVRGVEDDTQISPRAQILRELASMLKHAGVAGGLEYVNFSHLVAPSTHCV